MFVLRKLKSILIVTILGGFIFGFITLEVLAQKKKYTGNPVTEYGLTESIKSRQYQTRQMIAVIESNGVDFRLTKEIRKKLIAVGARLDLIRAVQRNYRFAKPVKNTGKPIRNTNQYDNQIAQAQKKFNVDGDAAGAILILERAIEKDPGNSRAHQLLGFVYLYGLKDHKMAEKKMKKAIDLGGSAVFRVRHSHDLTFSYSCDGSLYISKKDVRYESDNVEHTFDVPKQDIKRAKTLGGWGTFIRRKGGAFKITIRDRTDEDKEDTDKYNFSPITEKKKETKMIIRLIER